MSAVARRPHDIRTARLVQELPGIVKLFALADAGRIVNVEIDNAFIRNVRGLGRQKTDANCGLTILFDTHRLSPFPNRSLHTQTRALGLLGLDSGTACQLTAVHQKLGACSEGRFVARQVHHQI